MGGRTHAWTSWELAFTLLDKLDEAVGHARHRKIGDGFGYEPSMENVDVSPVEAVALAYWNVKTSKRHPGRRAKAVAF